MMYIERTKTSFDVGWMIRYFISLFFTYMTTSVFVYFSHDKSIIYIKAMLVLQESNFLP